MTQDQKEILKTFFNALEDTPLEPGDKRYIPHLEELPTGDPIAELAETISWSNKASVNLISGMRGSGKSTELLRLGKRLEGEGCAVLLSDMQEYLNLTQPIEITDFLISLMAGLGKAVQALTDVDPSLEGFWKRLNLFLTSEIDVKLNLSSDLGIFKAGLQASLKEDPDFKKQLQEKLRGHAARIVEEAQRFAGESVERIRKIKGDPALKVIYIVDSLEQIRGVGDEEAQSVYKSVENLFSGHASSLRFPDLHVVYTLPPYLTPLVPGVGLHLGGGAVHFLPSVHIRNKEREPDDRGIAVMARIVTARFPGWKGVFSDAQLHRIALSSGGDLREFFRLIKVCLTKAGSLSGGDLPVGDGAISSAEALLRRNMLPIAREDAEWLRSIAATKSAMLESTKYLPRLARFFDTSVLFNYRNEEDWYDIHPLLYGEIGIDDAPSPY